MGNVKFWDPKTCTQLQSFQGHAADVLCLTIGSVRFLTACVLQSSLTRHFRTARLYIPQASTKKLPSSLT